MSQDTITAAVFIGIHLRSESVHALAVTEHGDIVAEANAPYPKKNNPPSQKGFIEENPEVWWEGTRLAVGHLISQLRNRLANASQLKAVSVSCQPGALVALDRRNVPVLPAILADDERGFDYVKSLNFHGREHCERNGFVFRASDPIAKIAWIKDNHPNLYEDAVFVHQADFILGRLKGSPDVTEYSFAARTGCDLIDENWP
ncbi:MAG: hypothetical protein LBT89_08010, partial [Planctomycetaceae bacterium]|nr:hypothetical protein [Planctomycetaceae bacterium]